MNHRHRGLSEINQICDEFDSLWLAGQRPRLGEFLRTDTDSNNGPPDMGLARALLRVEIEHRLQHNESPSPRDYENFGLDVVRIAEEILDKNRAPKSPISDISEVVKADFEASTNGRYRLIKEYGKGGMGTVWIAAQQEPVKRQVAIKVMRADMDSRDATLRFQNERQTLAMMKHPNIAPIFDGGRTEQGRLYFVMEWVNGIPITDFCFRRKLDLKNRMRLIEGVCKALQHAHDRGVVHRDIKPENVLVELVDGLPLPRVIDFGLSKVIRKGSFDTTSLRTEHGKLIGTVSYMSPEQASLRKIPVDERSDIYSLGALTYHLLTGSPPLDSSMIHSETIIQILEQIRNRDPDLPSVKVESLTATTGAEPTHRIDNGLNWLVMKALEKSPEHRYQSARAMAEDIRMWLDHGAVNAQPQTWTHRVRQRLARNRNRAFAIGSAAIAILICSLLAMTYFQSAQSAEGRADKYAVDMFHGKLEKLERMQIANDFEWKAKLREYALQLRLAQAECSLERSARAIEILNAIEPQFRGWEFRYLSALAKGKGAATEPSQLKSELPRKVNSLDYFAGDVTCSFESPKLVAFGTADGLVKIYDKATRNLVDNKQVGASEITSVVLNRYSQIVFATTQLGKLKQFDVGGSEVYELGEFKNPTAMAISSDDSRLFIAEGPRIAVVQSLDGFQLLILEELNSPIKELSFVSDQTLISTTVSDEIRLWLADPVSP